MFRNYPAVKIAPHYLTTEYNRAHIESNTAIFVQFNEFALSVQLYYPKSRFLQQGFYVLMDPVGFAPMLVYMYVLLMITNEAYKVLLLELSSGSSCTSIHRCLIKVA